MSVVNVVTLILPLLKKSFSTIFGKTGNLQSLDIFCVICKNQSTVNQLIFASDLFSLFSQEQKNHENKLL